MKKSNKNTLGLSSLMIALMFATNNLSATVADELLIYHCDFKIDVTSSPRAERHDVYSGNLVVNDVLELSYYDDNGRWIDNKDTYLNLPSSHDDKYEARINISNSVAFGLSGSMSIVQKGAPGSESVVHTTIDDKSPKHITYNDGFTAYNLNCSYKK